MASIIKTSGTSVITLQSIASNTVVLSSTLDVTTKLAATIYVHFGRRATTALTTGMIFRVEGSAQTGGNGQWYPLAQYQTGIATSETEAVSGTVNAGTNVITVASTTNLVVGNIIYIDNGTIANSEWGRIKAVSSNTSVTIEDNLVNAQTGSNIFNQGEILPPFYVDLTAVAYLRLVCDGSGTGQAVAVQAYMVTGDSIG